MIIEIFLYLLIAFITFKYPKYSGLIIYLIISINPLLILMFSESFYLFSIVLVFVVMLITVYFKKIAVHRYMVLYLLLASFFIITQYIFINISFESIRLFIFKYVMIISIVYFSSKEIIASNTDLASYLKPYFIVNILVLFVRSFIDYSFFNAVFVPPQFSTDQFMFGGIFYRAANLNSSIIFSIELSAFLSIFILSKNKRNIDFIIIGFMMISLYLMNSRSAWFILLISMIYYFSRFYKNKKILIYIPILFTVVFFGIVYLSGLKDFFGNLALIHRIKSWLDFILGISNYAPNNLLFGFGMGSSDFYNNIFYVENYYLSIITEIGMVGFFSSLFIIFMLINKLNSKEIYYMPIVAILITNMFSSNMTSYTVFIIFLYMLFWGLNEKHVQKRLFEHPQNQSV